MGGIMQTRRSVIVLAALALMTSVLLVAPAAADHHASGCDPDYVHIDGKNITVLPLSLIHISETTRLQ